MKRGIITMGLAGGMALLAVRMSAPAPAQWIPAGQGAAANVSDDQIVAAMKRGIDYLLQHKTGGADGDNWESGRNWNQQGQHGGETSLALYALLHAGESLRDDPDYGPKLNYRSRELAPVVKWVEQVDAEETYTVSLQASALALVPQEKNAKPGEGPHDALKRDLQFLTGAMGVQGGYTYGTLGSTRRGGFDEAWARYFALKIANGNPQDLAAAKVQLDSVVRNLQGSFGGAEFEIAHHIADLRQMARDNPGRDMASAVDAEVRELQRYQQGMPKSPNIDYAADLARARQALAEAERFGGGRGAGAAQAALDAAIANAQNHFHPIGDLSNAQFGALGMWALADAGLDVRVEYWQATDRFWRLLQRSDGSWPYTAVPGVRDLQSDAMGVAGIASLYIAQEFADRMLRTTPKLDKNLDQGLAWLNANFRPDSSDYYYMYAVERVGLASGLKYFGMRDWYAQGAAAMVRAQHADGSWTGADTLNLNWSTPLTSTCFALLFLSRGRNPVLFNKLQYNGPWNARPRDDAALTRWISKRFERPLNWQVVNLDVDATGWMDAPVLLMTGSRDPMFTDDEVAKIRMFIDAGGMIFSTADDGSKEFTDAMERYAAQVTAGKYAIRELDKTHAMFSRELGVETTNPPKLMGMSNGVRELWIHSTVDMGASWQLQRISAKEDFEVPAALYLYATGKTALKGKFKDLQVPDPAHVPARKATLARIVYAGNADPEPGAWPRLAKLLRAEENGIDLSVVLVKPAELDPAKEQIAHLTGTGAFTLKAVEVDALRKYLDGGGVLLADAGGGSKEFGDSFSKLVAALYPDGGGLKAVGPDEAVITGAFAAGKGPAVREVGFRKSGLLALGKSVDEPNLLGASVGGKMRIVFSPYDITSGLLGTNTWGITGYTPESSQKLAENMVRFALEK